MNSRIMSAFAALTADRGFLAIAETLKSHEDLEQELGGALLLDQRIAFSRRADAGKLPDGIRLDAKRLLGLDVATWEAIPRRRLRARLGGFARIAVRAILALQTAFTRKK